MYLTWVNEKTKSRRLYCLSTLFEWFHPICGIVIGIVDLVQAILRHLEVRWQLFNEALSRFRDLEAMLAICAGNLSTTYRHNQCFWAIAASEFVLVRIAHQASVGSNY